MRSALLQKLLDKQKQNKYGDYVANNQWPEIYSQIIAKQTKLTDILPALNEANKLIKFTEFIATIEPNTTNLKILSELLPKIPSDQLPELTPYLKNLVLGFTQYQAQIVDMLVRSFFISDSQIFVDTLLSLLQAIPAIHSAISASITKFFPQTNFPVDQQVHFLRNSLVLCSASNDVAISSLSRIFQHFVALDCELLFDAPSSDGSIRVDDDVAQCFIPQMSFFMEFISNANSTIMTLLLQFFDLYLIDLPKVVAVQFVYFFSSSLDHSNFETFVGFLLAKMIDDSASLRSRSNATLYLESLIVHARYIDDDFAALTLDYVSNYALCYASHISSEVPDQFKMDIKMHHMYYFAVQCLSYVICWRYKSFTDKNINIVERWHIDELLYNELKAIDVIDKNTSDMVKSFNLFEARHEDSVVIERIAVWFPFDPCPLDEMADFVSDNYIQWNELNEEDEDVNAILDQELSRLQQNHLFNFDITFSQNV